MLDLLIRKLLYGGVYVKTAIKHNLLLLQKIHPAYVVSILFIIILWIKNGSSLFIVVIPVITTLSIIAIESFDGKIYDTLFSLPITRKETAKAKFLTLLIVYVITTLFILTLHYISVLNGTTKLIENLPFILELSLTFPLSVFLGGLSIGIGGEFRGTIALIYVFFMNLFILNLNVDLQLGKDIILDVFVFIIWLGLCIISCVGTKRSMASRYLNMEL